MMNWIRLIFFTFFLACTGGASATDLSGLTTANCESQVTVAVDSLKNKKKLSEINFDYEACYEDVFVDNLSNRVLYILFGGVITDFMNASSDLLGDGVDYNGAYDSLEAAYTLSALIKQFTVLVNYVALALLSIIAIKVLIASQGAVSREFLKSLMKIFVGFSLIAPVAVLDGYSLLQGVLLFCVVASVILANAVWLFVIFTISVFSLQNSQDLNNVDADITAISAIATSFDDVLLPNIKAHICDIRAVEKALATSVTGVLSKENIEGTPLYQCLQEAPTATPTDDLAMPVMLRHSRNCLRKNDFLSTSSGTLGYCGYFASADSDIETLRGGYNVLSGAHQIEMRQIATNIHAAVCSTINVVNVESGLRELFCMQQSGYYQFTYSPETGFAIPIGAEVIVNKEGEKQKYKAISQQLLAKFLALKDPIANSETGLTSIVRSSVAINEKMVTSLLMSLRTGWMGSTMIYTMGNLTTVDYVGFAEMFTKIYRFETRDFGYPYGTFNSDRHGFQRPLDDAYASILHNYDINVEKEISSLSTKYTAPAYSIYNLVGSPTVINDESLNDGGCFALSSGTANESLKCSSQSLNPFYNLIGEGNKLLDYALFPLIVVNIIDEIMTQWFSIQVGFTGILATFLKFVIAIGLFISFFLPMIPFFVFATVVIGWVIDLFKMILSMQFLALLYLIPDDREDFEGEESSMYKNLLSLVITPVFLVFGAIVAFAMVHFSIAITNATFSYMVEYMNMPYSPSGITEMIDNVVIVMIYLIITTLLVIKSSSMIYEVPRFLKSYFDLNISTNDGMFRQMRQIGERIILLEVAQ
jgi:hypothetical protein